MAFTTIKKGSKGDMVMALQYVIGVKADGIFGSDTKTAVKNYQKKNGLTADGEAGKKTFTVIVEKAPVLRFGATGAYVYAMEALLNTLKLDGIYAQDEVDHVKTYQASKNLEIDGIVGKKTWSALFGLDTTISTTTNNGANTKQPVNYKQYDSRWAKIVYTRNNTYNKNQTIKSSGCGPTSMADILATWFDKNITPKETCALSVANGYRTKNDGTSWDYFKFVSTKYPFPKFIQTSSFATMQNCLAAGGLVVVSFRPSKWTNGGHFCCLWKDDGKNIYVNDPASASSARAKGTYAEVKAAAKQYFCFYPPAK